MKTLRTLHLYSNQSKSANQAALISSKKHNQLSIPYNPGKKSKSAHITNHDSSYDINDHIKDSKLLIDELKSKKIFENNDPRLKKFSIFKTSPPPIPDDKEKYTSNGILLSNTNQRVKKSISFTKPLVNEKQKTENIVKESTPLYDHTQTKSDPIVNSTGLLTTVNDNQKTQPPSMVTFGNSMQRKVTKQQNLSGSTSMSSTNTASNSPATSSTNNDSEYTNNSPINLPESNDSYSDQQNYSSIQQKPNKLSTFTHNPNNSSVCSSPFANEPFNYTNPNSNRSLYSAPRPRFVDKVDTRPPLPPNTAPSNPKTTAYSSLRSTTTYTSDILETKFLNKLCEDIEVSLNVDCECADDYSSNDFSGDYSFDNDLIKHSMSNKVGYQRPLNGQGLKLNPIHNKINNLEQNIKQMRHGGSSSSNGSGGTKGGSFEYKRNNSNNNHIGVLV